jgi:hypothetical protein
MSHRLPLYHKALLAWRHELEKQYRAILEDKETPLRERLRRKLAEITGYEYIIEVEDRNDDPYDAVLGAKVENLNFLAFRSPEGVINVVLLMPCPHCDHQMPSDPLTRLADLGRELLQFDMHGTLSNHQCTDLEAH